MSGGNVRVAPEIKDLTRLEGIGSYLSGAYSSWARVQIRRQANYLLTSAWLYTLHSYMR